MIFGPLHITGGRTGLGDNGHNRPWRGYCYGSYVPRFHYNGGRPWKREVLDLGGYWLCWHWSITLFQSGIMRRPPIIWNLQDLVLTTQMLKQATPNGYIPLRPQVWVPLFARLKAAWAVFRGECDAVRWPNNQ